MNPTQTFVIALLASIPTFLGGLLAFIQGMKSINQIHTIVNSQREAMTAEIRDLRAKIGALEALLSRGTDNAGGAGW